LAATLRRMKLFAVIPTLFTVTTLAWANPQQAQQIIDEYEHKTLVWEKQYREAGNIKQQRAILQMQPKAFEYGEKLRNLVGGHINRSWSIPYQCWLLENHPRFFRPAADGNPPVDYEKAVMNIFEKNHYADAQAGRFALSLALSTGKNPQNKFQKMRIAEKILKEHKDKKQRALASLSLAILLDANDQEAAVTKRRMELLKGSVDAFSVRVGRKNVGDLAQDELYRMQNLEKGRIAPDIQGFDSAGKPHKLSDYRGNVLLLTFWSRLDYGALEYAASLRKLIEKRANKPFGVLGVNADNVFSLRALQANGQVTWKNFSDPKGQLFKAYRVDQTPTCYVIDKKGVIRYKGALGAFAELTIDAVLAEK